MTEQVLSVGGNTSLLGAIRIQSRVIGALLLREILTRHGRQNIGFMWIFVEPMIFTLGVVTLRGFFRESGASHGVDAVSFCVLGYATILMWRNTIGRSGDSVRSNKPLMFHRNVRVLDVFIARALLEIAGASTSFVILSALFVFVGMMAMPHDVLTMLGGWLLLTWFSIAMGMIVGAATVFSEIVSRIWHVFSYLFLVLSGAFFMVDWLPAEQQRWALYVPTVNCVELLREGFYGPPLRAYYSVEYVLWINLCLTALGLAGVKHAARKLEEGAE